MIKKIVFIAASVAVCCACSDELDNHRGQTLVQLVATISDEVNSKTVATDEGQTYSVTWTGTEKVAVNGQHSKTIEVDTDNPKRAVFTFDGISAPYASVYPAAASKSTLQSCGVVYVYKCFDS